MRFLMPIYFGLTLFMVGVILFYLFRREYDKQVVPSTYLWRQVMREWQATKWWRKLQRHLLLYLQLLILAILIMAMVRPYVGVNALSGEHIVVVIDTSASMSANEDDKTRLDHAKEEVDTIIDQLNNQQMTAIIAGKTPSILFSNVTSKAAMRNGIQALDITYQSSDINVAVQLANQLLSGSTGEVHVFSDRVDSEAISGQHIDNTIAIHNIGTSTNNLTLNTFGVAEQAGKINGVLTIYNEMESDQLVRISIEHEGIELVHVEEKVKPNQTSNIYVKDLPIRDYYRAIIVDEDDYEIDNESIAFPMVAEQPSIYLVGDINPFVTKALNHLGTEIIHVEKSTEFPDTYNGIYILENVPFEHWPDGPLLVMSPETGKPYDIQSKTGLTDTLDSVNEDPLLQFVIMEDVYIQSSFPYNDSGLQSIVSSGGTPLISKGHHHGYPFVLLGFDIEDTDWPLHPGFPIFLHNSIQFLTVGQDTLGYLLPYELKDIALSAQTEKGFILNAAYKQITELNNDTTILEAPNKPGLYRIKEETKTGVKERLFAVVLDEEEKSISPEKSFTIVHEDKQALKSERDHPNELWKWFALFGLLFLMLEWEVYRRGTTT